MTYAEAIHFLYALQMFGARPGLETTRRLAVRAGNPQDKLRFIHVAGTNGKGSTCAMLESVYRAAGLRVGLFTSPHLVSFRERIQVNRRLIGESDVGRLVTELRESERRSPDRLATNEHQRADSEIGAPTLFEFVTVMALRYFAEQKCDLVIWETGLGGRLDATNIVTPLASVITNIGLDHQQWLGNTLAEIAAEKAGIIKPGVPILTATDEPEALAVIRQTARSLRAPLTCVSPDHAARVREHVALPLLGDHQRLNAALALAVVDVLQGRLPVSGDRICAGLSRVHWPGRLQIITRPDGRRILLDGAHNIAGVEALAAALEKFFPNARPTMILGMLADKDWRPMCARLAMLADRILTVPVGSERTAKAADLAAVCRAAGPPSVAECSSPAEALELAAADSFVVITGSLYLVGEALQLLEPGSAGGEVERALNDWTRDRSVTRAR
jgi:dihydrofolate synthase/folylpolyglutamate synthase